MKAISGKRMGKILEERGWILARITGSHHIFIRQGSNLRITVPIHGHQDLKIGLQRTIMKLAGISENEL
ncbi:MAG: type II toxin-antitoxin system HicA family toxin [Phycisphaerales bacterium]|nr:type II toxin-antitoxin system HicA family toxin [Phycisphaerales bacterium]